VNDAIGLESGENRRHQIDVEDIASNQLESAACEGVREVSGLDGGIVELVEVVDPQDLMSRGEQTVDEMRADEARGAGDEDSHGHAFYSETPWSINCFFVPGMNLYRITMPVLMTTRSGSRFRGGEKRREPARKKALRGVWPCAWLSMRE
jgi:hypothetical protein